MYRVSVVACRIFDLLTAYERFFVVVVAACRLLVVGSNSLSRDGTWAPALEVQSLSH